jgi:peptidoglycan hydrolase-like protein with peptidoglycan-binding domain
MALRSQLFRGDGQLEAAAVSDPAHILPGASGPHVARIQQALIQLDGAAISQDSAYGPATAAAVGAFKQKRQILNFEGKIDNIVGRKTIAALDAEMLAKESGGGGADRGRAGLRFLVNPDDDTPVGPPVPPPSVQTKPLDIFVQFTGALGSGQGLRDPNGEKKFKDSINSSSYLQTHQPMEAIIFSGGRGAQNPFLDAANEVFRLRLQNSTGVTIVVGTSVGGLSALQCAALLTLSTVGLNLDYVALSDAAFFDRDFEIITVDPLLIRGTIFSAKRTDNFFQTFGHELFRNLAGVPLQNGFPIGTEFHGPVSSLTDQDMGTFGPRTTRRIQQAKRLKPTKEPGILLARASAVHAAAAADGDEKWLSVVKSLIKP